MADRHHARSEPIDRGADVIDEALEREVRGVRRLAPVVVAQVEGMALPAATGEIAEEPLPGPRAGKLAMHEQQRLAPRATLGQPGLDVQAAVVQLDLVLADGPTRRRQEGIGARGHRSSIRAG